MQTINCNCGYIRKLRSDGYVEACSFCREPEFDTLEEARGTPQDYEYEWVDLSEICSAEPKEIGQQTTRWIN